MATIGDILSKINDAGIKSADSVDLVILNADGDEVEFDINGYDEVEDQFLITVKDFEIPAPQATNEVAAKKQIVSVSVPEGVEVDIIHMTATPEDSDD